MLRVNLTVQEDLLEQARETTGALIGEAFAMIVHPEDQKAVLSHLAHQFSHPSGDGHIEYRKLRRDGWSF